MTNFNIPPPANQYTGNLTASQGFFKGKRRAHQANYILIWLKLILAEKWEITDLKALFSL
jgi:hypothetical protein